MTCRAARLSQDHFPIDRLFCSECGSANPDRCDTSKSLGQHLCPICAQSIAEGGAGEENHSRSPLKTAVVKACNTEEQEIH